MKDEAASFDEELDELDDLDSDEGEEERGLSGFVVLLMGVVMLGALASVVWIAYKQGIRNGQEANGAPYVTADPEPLKIENKVADAAGGGEDLEVYDKVEGRDSEPVEVIAKGPEEPVARSSEDPIGAIASGATEPADDAVADRIAELAKADEAANGAAAPAPAAPTAKPSPPPAAKPEPRPATPTTPAAATGSAAPTANAAGALTGTHLVQIGAFKSADEANGQWSRLQGKLGGFLDGKSNDVERADLGSKGVYYRLRIGPFASASEAKTYCAGLKERGTDCLIKAK